VLIDGRSHGDVQGSVNQADDELLGVDLRLSFEEHKSLNGLFKILHRLDQLLPGAELIDLPFELL